MSLSNIMNTLEHAYNGWLVNAMNFQSSYMTAWQEFMPVKLNRELYNYWVVNMMNYMNFFNPQKYEQMQRNNIELECGIRVLELESQRLKAEIESLKHG